MYNENSEYKQPFKKEHLNRNINNKIDLYFFIFLFFIAVCFIFFFLFFLEEMCVSVNERSVSEL